MRDLVGDARSGSRLISRRAVHCSSSMRYVPGWRNTRFESRSAADKEHVLNAVGTAAMAMRAKLGESLSFDQKLSDP